LCLLFLLLLYYSLLLHISYDEEEIMFLQMAYNFLLRQFCFEMGENFEIEDYFEILSLMALLKEFVIVQKRKCHQRIIKENEREKKREMYDERMNTQKLLLAIFFF